MKALLLFIPIGILGLIRWSSWLIRRVPAVLYRPYVEGHREPLTVVTPVYQEDPDLFRAAVGSWLANDGVEEVIAVIDETDTACIEVARELSGDPRVTLIITDVPGKRDALRRGWEAAKTELVALVDSDTVWADDVARRVVEPFEDPEIGGVGTRQNVLNPATLWQRLNDFYLDSRYFDEIAGQTRWGEAVSCLSGRTAVYRRDLLLQVSDDFMGETFMGVQCNSGEDKRLTMLTLKAGYRTWMQQNARVWSTFPRGARTFFRQRMRWARNTWRSDLRCLKEGWIFRHKWLAFSMIDKAVSSFTLLVAPIFLIIAMATGHWAIAGLLALWWLVSRAIKYLPHLQRRPADVVLLPVFILTTFVVAALKIVALLSVRRQRWLTRDVAVVNGKVARTTQTTPRPAAGAAGRSRWPLVGALGAGVAIVVATAGFAQAQVGSSNSGGAGNSGSESAQASTTTAKPAAAGTETTAAPGPAAKVPATPAGSCKDPAAPPTRAEDNPLYGGTNPKRDLKAYSPPRIAQTKCTFPADYRAIVIDPGRVRLQAGGQVVRQIDLPATTGPLEFANLATAINDRAWIAETGAGTYEVKAAIFQRQGTKLSVAGPRVRELRLIDLPHVFIGGEGAQARFDGVKVTSWAKEGNGPDLDFVNGRPFVLYERGSRLDINASNLEYLGSDRASAYGVAWRLGGTTGTVTKSKFTNNYFGVYTFEADGLTFRENEFTDNVFYGADPHDRSRNLLFENNLFQGNGSHGAIVSKEVHATVFRQNRAINNGGNGLVIDTGSYNVKLEDNEVVGNQIDGIVVLGSRDNEIINNIVRENRVGIRVNGKGADGNKIQGNTVENNGRGIQVYGGATALSIDGAVVKESERAGIVVEAPSTRVLNVDVTGGPLGIDLRAPAQVEGATISDVEVGVAVRSTEPVSLAGVDVTATDIGVRVDRRSEAQLSNSRVEAPQPYKGSEQITKGTNTSVKTLAPPGLHWLGFAGFAFLIVALVMEAIRRLRSRGFPSGGKPPAIVTSNFA